MCSAPLTALQIYILFRLILNKHKKSFIFDDECLMLKYMKHNIIRLDIVDSTNNEAKRRIDSLADLDVIAAYEQTAGRGQGDHTWLSAPGMNLTFSIILKYGEGSKIHDVPADGQVVIMGIVTDTILELLSDHGIDANVKWPNDIYVAGRKICGILIEHAVRGRSLVHSIIGVGLNVNQTMFDESLPDPTSMLLETDGEELDPDLLLEELMDIFHKNIDNITYNR